jgi:hypothetical protein
MHVQVAYWVDWRSGLPEFATGARLYFGHATCAVRLPAPPEAAEFARRACDAGCGVTFVTPFLTERQIGVVLDAVEALSTLACGLEVVCSDWGLLHRLRDVPGCRPALGHLLAMPPADPRLSRVFAPPETGDGARTATHVDGTVCRVEWKAPSSELARHYRGCWVDKPSAQACLVAWNVHRCELANLPQGIRLDHSEGMAYSLHVPDVPVTVLRRCPGPDEDVTRPRTCGANACAGSQSEWTLKNPPLTLRRRDNALYYRNASLPENLADLPVDRLVVDRR